MRRLSTLNQPYADNHTICQDFCRLSAIVRLVLRLANELLLHRLRALDLDDQGCRM